MINRKVVDIYKISVPAILRDKITMLRNAGGLDTTRKNIMAYYKSQAVNDEIRLVLNYLKKKPLQLFPYQFPKKYNPSNIKVYHDDKRDLNYVMHEEKRMYFKRSWHRNDVKENYTNLLIEQDKDSPHRYITENFTINENDVVADIGAAEGIFSLAIIESAEKVCLFETDNEWIEALKATFSPWKNKVEIINKFVSDKNDDTNITLDKWTKDENIFFDFIKIDVDGAETALLKGCHEILSQSRKIKIAICTYHKAEDEKLFTDLFKKYNISSNPSAGYMIFYFDDSLSEPYLRRGILRAEK